ncbi:hypothetical protein HK097_000194 [Rhizophlyctis rosea]|uniref:Uncharacterized protein n=1 Tax=Rhizophlyctis rosea TaxID=64517 RepID=A0AAD5SHG2_9FUNG|nr:hypothetical protein HK097_000194 [Rhizophlyctis rosea]
MSLRPKKVNFEAVYAVFQGVLVDMYDFANAKVSGIDMFQQVYDMCTAHPRPYTEQLFNALAAFLSERCSACAAVGGIDVPTRFIVKQLTNPLFA